MTMYGYNISLAASSPDTAAPDLLYRVKTYPDDFGMSSMKPSDFAALSSRIKSDEATAKNFIERMCDTPDCYEESCDATCRNELACVLDNASQQDIIACRQKGLADPEYGFDYVLSTLENPWVKQYTR
jgi:hypothetical protein